MSSTAVRSDPFRPARRVAGQKQDVWYVMLNLGNDGVVLTVSPRSIVNEAAAASPVQPIVNMGQGFL